MSQLCEKGSVLGSTILEQAKFLYTKLGGNSRDIQSLLVRIYANKNAGPLPILRYTYIILLGSPLIFICFSHLMVAEAERGDEDARVPLKTVIRKARTVVRDLIVVVLGMVAAF